MSLGRKGAGSAIGFAFLARRPPGAPTNGEKVQKSLRSRRRSRERATAAARRPPVVRVAAPRRSPVARFGLGLLAGVLDQRRTTHTKRVGTTRGPPSRGYPCPGDTSPKGRHRGATPGKFTFSGRVNAPAGRAAAHRSDQAAPPRTEPQPSTHSSPSGIRPRATARPRPRPRARVPGRVVAHSKTCYSNQHQKRARRTQRSLKADKTASAVSSRDGFFICTFASRMRIFAATVENLSVSCGLVGAAPLH